MDQIFFFRVGIILNIFHMPTISETSRQRSLKCCRNSCASWNSTESGTMWIIISDETIVKHASDMLQFPYGFDVIIDYKYEKIISLLKIISSLLSAELSSHDTHERERSKKKFTKACKENTARDAVTRRLSISAAHSRWSVSIYTLTLKKKKLEKLSFFIAARKHWKKQSWKRIWRRSTSQSQSTSSFVQLQTFFLFRFLRYWHGISLSSWPLREMM